MNICCCHHWRWKFFYLFQQPICARFHFLHWLPWKYPSRCISANSWPICTKCGGAFSYWPHEHAILKIQKQVYLSQNCWPICSKCGLQVHVDHTGLTGGPKIRGLPEAENNARLPSVCPLSSVCLQRSCTLLRGWKLGQYFFVHVYLSHLLSSVQNFKEIIPGESLPRGEGVNARGVAKYRDGGPI